MDLFFIIFGVIGEVMTLILTYKRFGLLGVSYIFMALSAAVIFHAGF